MTDWTRATEIAQAILLHLADDPELIAQLCTETGLDPADLRATTGDAGFVAAMLDFIAADDRRAIRDVLTQLSPEQRRVVELRLAGLTGPEIREVLGRSRAWVDTTQYRAVKRLRAVMAADVAKERDDAGR